MSVPGSVAVWLVVAAVVLIVIAATLAAAEAALSRLTRAETVRLVNDGRRGAAAVQEIVADPAPALSTSTLVRVTAEAAATVCATIAATTWTHRWWAAVLLTALVMGVVGFTALGVSPRTVGRQHPEGVALRTAGRLRGMTRTLGPLARLLVAVANAMTPGRGYRDGPFSTEGELRELVDRASESAIIEVQERDLIHSVFELGETFVREVMSPRTDMVTVSADASPREAMTLFVGSGHSRMPVVGESSDDVVGILLLKDVARALHDRRGSGRRAADLARPPVFVPETKLVDALLREMQTSATHLALVVDEYGGVAGLVTLEDLLEEIVGDIADEHDVEVPDVVALPDGGFRVSSRLPVDELADLFGVQVEDDDVDSVGGLLAKELGTVPVEGSRAVVAGLLLCADGVEGHRITTVIARRATDPGAEPVPGPATDAAPPTVSPDDQPADPTDDRPTPSAPPTPSTPRTGSHRRSVQEPDARARS